MIRERQLITEEEASELLSISIEQLHNLIDKGILNIIYKDDQNYLIKNEVENYCVYRRVT